MAAVFVFAGDCLGAGGVCILCIGDYVDSGGFRVCNGAGLFGTGDYLFGFEGIRDGSRTPDFGKYSNVVALSLHKNVTDARFEKTSPSADVFIGTPYGIFTKIWLRY